MDKQKAITIMQEHIESYNYQLSDRGWREMVGSGLAGSGYREKIKYAAFANEQIKAYELAIAALKDYSGKE